MKAEHNEYLDMSAAVAVPNTNCTW